MIKKPKMNKLIEPNLTVVVIDFWFIEAFKMNNDNYMRIFPFELFEEIIKYCRIIGVLDFVCDPRKLEQLARVAETAERYDDMIELMIELVKVNSRQFKCICCDCNDNDISMQCEILNMDERNLLSVAFKNVVGTKRASWRTLSSCENSELYMRVIERELHETCLQLLDLLECYIINKIKYCTNENKESMVFYLKMAG
eukprot:752824_1